MRTKKFASEIYWPLLWVNAMLKSVNYDQVEFYYILDILTIHYYKKQDLPEKNHFEMNIAERKPHKKSGN